MGFKCGIVGLPNVGKSTLFNAITTGDVYVADQLFATLDPTLRKVKVPGVGPAILADTVGFIRHLPHRLVQAFRATLEETVNATLLLHVTDCSAEERDSNVAAVDEVLEEIGGDKLPVLHVVAVATLPRRRGEEHHVGPRCQQSWLISPNSALTGSPG